MHHTSARARLQDGRCWQSCRTTWPLVRSVLTKDLRRCEPVCYRPRWTANVRDCCWIARPRPLQVERQKNLLGLRFLTNWQYWSSLRERDNFNQGWHQGRLPIGRISQRRTNRTQIATLPWCALLQIPFASSCDRVLHDWRTQVEVYMPQHWQFNSGDSRRIPPVNKSKLLHLKPFLEISILLFKNMYDLNIIEVINFNSEFKLMGFWGFGVLGFWV